MRITLVVPSFNLGGGELVTIRLAVELGRDSSNQVSVISLYEPTPGFILDQALAEGVNVLSLDKQPGFDFFLIFKLARAIRKNRPDVLHTHLGAFRYSVFSSLFCRIRKKCHTIHTMPLQDVSLTPRLLSSLAFSILGWTPVVLSSIAEEEFLHAFGMPPSVVSNGVPCALHDKTESSTVFREKHGLPPSGQLLLMVGRICPVKNYALAIDAFQIVAQKPGFEYCHLIIVGDHQDQDYCEQVDQRVASLDNCVSSRIHFLGSRNDVAAVMSASDLLLLTSTNEGMPLVVLEAMSQQLPVVSSSVGGIPDILEHGVSGLLFKSGDVESLVDELARLLADQSLSTRLTARAFEVFKQNFGVDIMARRYMSLYQADAR
jgi:glycosyltransferase involved in cell wall biosynthesis